MNRNGLAIIAFTAINLAFVSCSKSTDLYDQNMVNEAKAAQEVNSYESNFVETFGEIKSDQNWDFSNGQEIYTLPSSDAKTRANTRADSYTMTTSSDYYQIEDNTLAKMKSVFVEGKNNQALGEAFAMTVPGNSFTIMPIFMGQSGGDFTLYMHVDGIGEIKVWDKWTNMQAQFNTNTWQDLYKDRKYYSLYGSYTVRESTTGGMNTTNATAIQSKYYTFSGLPEGANMYFYLQITTAAGSYNSKGQCLGSVNNYMREYKFTADELPSSLPGVENPEVKIIGCEDASNTSLTDLDYNDVVFMIYGEPYAPGSFKVDNLERQVTKRYMVEDLGTTDDIDFNDIVVDVVTTYNVEKTTNQDQTVVTYNETLKSRKAQIRAMGGTLDFVLKMGNTTWKKSDHFTSTEMLNTTSPDYTKVLAEFALSNDWDPAKNDISVSVIGEDGTTSSIGFPNVGNVPMIIALDPVDWSLERKPFAYLNYLLGNMTAEE